MLPLVWDTGVVQRTAEDAAYRDCDRRIAHLAKHSVDSSENKKQIIDKLFEDLDSGRAEAVYTAGHEGTALLLWLTIGRDATAPLDWVRANVRYPDLPAIQDAIDRLSFPDAHRKRKQQEGESPNAQTPAPQVTRLGTATTTTTTDNAIGSGSAPALDE